MPPCEPMNMVSGHMTSMQNPLWKRERNRTNGKCEAHMEGGRALAVHALRKPSMRDRRRPAAEPGRPRRTAWEKPTPTANNTAADPVNLEKTVFTNEHTPSTASFSLIRSVTVGRPQQPDGGTHLAVRGADGKPDVGGDHHCERRGQLNGEAAAGGAQDTHYRRSLYQPH